MAERIAQSTSYELAFKAFLTTTGAEATGLTIAMTISKNGATSFGAMHVATNATEIGNGWYFVVLDSTDTATLGRLAVRGTNASINDVGIALTVISATTGGATNLDVASSTLATPTNITAGTITSVGSVTGAVGSVTSRVTANTDQLNGQTVTAAAGVTFPSSVASPTNITAGTITNVGTVTSVTNRVTANTDELAGQTVTAAAGVTFPSSVASPTNITAGTITNVGTVTTVTTVTNLTNAPTNGDLTAAMKASVTAAVPTAAQNATELLDQAAGVEANLTVRQQLRLAAAALYGKAAGLSTTTVTFRDTNDTVDRITATVDASGDRTAVTLNST